PKILLEIDIFETEVRSEICFLKDRFALCRRLDSVNKGRNGILFTVNSNQTGLLNLARMRRDFALDIPLSRTKCLRGWGKRRSSARNWRRTTHVLTLGLGG